MQEEITKFIQTNSPDGGFLQSDEWRKFQKSVGRKTFEVSGNDFFVSIIEHELPIVGKYFYIPRGPIVDTRNPQPTTHNQLNKIIQLSEENNAGWIRFDPISGKITELIHELIPELKIRKAPHDMQPKELFIIDIKKSEEQLLADMKSKTRYNIKLAQKHGVKVSSIRCKASDSREYINKFIELVKITARRDKITPHPDGYYRKVFEVIPEENIKLYIAEYENKIVAANINIIYGKVATYLHGASDNAYRNVMAPYLLQWQAILDAKTAGCDKYDFGGVRTADDSGGWAGITRFKTGFSATTATMIFPGSYDIVVNPFRYNLYRIIQSIKALFYG